MFGAELAIAVSRLCAVLHSRVLCHDLACADRLYLQLAPVSRRR